MIYFLRSKCVFILIDKQICFYHHVLVLLLLLRKNVILHQNLWNTVEDYFSQVVLYLNILLLDFSLNYKIQLHVNAVKSNLFLFELLKNRRKRKKMLLAHLMKVNIIVPFVMLIDFVMFIHFKITITQKHTTFSKKKVAVVAFCTNHRL